MTANSDMDIELDTKEEVTVASDRDTRPNTINPFQIFQENNNPKI